MEWIKTSERLPKKSDSLIHSQTLCITYRNGNIEILVFNHYHQCWDDSSGDDFMYHIHEIEYWMPLPEPPIK